MTITALVLGAVMMLRDEPCEGCVASIPQTDARPVPLLVVLHGDYGLTPAQMERAWAKHASPRGIAVLSISCPKSLGCEGSFWKWNGDPKWLVDQVDALSEKIRIDRDRTWIAGWSGGATYIGMHTQTLEKRFAAVVHHGGGYPPLTSGCGSPPAPVYFLVGDANPLHAHVKLLRDHYAACGSDLVWNLQRKADHAGEWRALDAHAPAILEWLSSKRRAPDPPPAVAPPPPPTETVQPAPISSPRGCGCTMSPFAAVIVVAARRRRVVSERAACASRGASSHSTRQ